MNYQLMSFSPSAKDIQTAKEHNLREIGFKIDDGSGKSLIQSKGNC